MTNPVESRLRCVIGNAIYGRLWDIGPYCDEANKKLDAAMGDPLTRQLLEDAEIGRRHREQHSGGVWVTADRVSEWRTQARATAAEALENVPIAEPPHTGGRPTIRPGT